MIPSANRKIELSRGTSSPRVYNPTALRANHKNAIKLLSSTRKTSPSATGDDKTDQTRHDCQQQAAPRMAACAARVLAKFSLDG
jgi:hypothetical protein